MSYQTLRFGTLSLLLGAAVLARPSEAAEAPIRPGNRVVTTTEAPVKVGSRTLATVPAGSKMTATAVRGDWVAVTITKDGKSVTGWIATQHVSAFHAPDISETQGTLKQTKKAPSGPGAPAPEGWTRLGLTPPGPGGWSHMSFKEFPLDKEGSYVQCGSQRCRIDHSGDSFVLLDPITFKMSESDPLAYGKQTEGLPSTSVIWVEPGDQPGTVIVTTDPESVESDSLTALGLRRETMPKLRLEFHVVMQVGGAEFRYLLGKGAKYWGATKGPVSLDGKTYRNLKGAEVRQVAKRGTSGQGFRGFGQGFGNAGYGTLLQNTESKYTYELIGAEPASPNQ